MDLAFAFLPGSSPSGCSLEKDHCRRMVPWERAAFHIYICVDLCFEASDSSRSLVRCGAAVIEPGTIQSITGSTLQAATVTLLIDSIGREGQRSTLFLFLQQRNAAREGLWMSVKKCLCIFEIGEAPTGTWVKVVKSANAHNRTHSFPWMAWMGPEGDASHRERKNKRSQRRKLKRKKRLSPNFPWRYKWGPFWQRAVEKPQNGVTDSGTERQRQGC